MTTPVPDETILGILAASSQHGYQILGHFNDPKALGRIWTMSTSQIYAVLKRLEIQGLIAGSKTPSTDGPPKKEFSITPQGKITLNDWLHATNPSTSIRRIRVEFLSKLYIARLLGLPTSKIITPQIQSCQRQKQKLAKRYAEIDSEMEKVAVGFILGQLDAALSWLERLE